MGHVVVDVESRERAAGLRHYGMSQCKLTGCHTRLEQTCAHLTAPTAVSQHTKLVALLRIKDIHTHTHSNLFLFQEEEEEDTQMVGWDEKYTTRANFNSNYIT